MSLATTDAAPSSDGEIGFENVGVDADVDTSTHGNEASFEFVVGEKSGLHICYGPGCGYRHRGAPSWPREIMENELVMGTDAYKNGNVVYLAHPAVWYTAEGGGVTALDVMLSDLESELLSE